MRTGWLLVNMFIALFLVGSGIVMGALGHDIIALPALIVGGLWSWAVFKSGDKMRKR